MQPLRLPNGATLIHDAYNANPQSMEAALRSLARLRGAGRAIAVLGDMGELGSTAEAAHQEAGALAAALGLDSLYARGRFALTVTRAAIAGGLDPAHVHVGESHEEIAEALARELGPRDVVLVKGSRSARMERVVEALAGPSEGHA